MQKEGHRHDGSKCWKCLGLVGVANWGVMGCNTQVGLD